MENLFILKCNHLSNILKGDVISKDVEVLINYSTHLLKQMKEYIDSFQGTDEQKEDLNNHYQILFSDFVEFQEKRA